MAIFFEGVLSCSAWAVPVFCRSEFQYMPYYTATEKHNIQSYLTVGSYNQQQQHLHFPNVHCLMGSFTSDDTLK